MEDKTFELLTKMYAEFSGKFNSMEGKIGSLEDKIGSLEGKIGSLEGKVGSLEGKVDNIEGELKSLKHVVTKIENDHGKKLDALFDGYKQINDRLDRIETEVSKHEEVILKRVR